VAAISQEREHEQVSSPNPPKVGFGKSDGGTLTPYIDSDAESGAKEFWPNHLSVMASAA